MHVHRTTDEPCDPKQCSSCLSALVEVMDHAWGRGGGRKERDNSTDRYRVGK